MYVVWVLGFACLVIVYRVRCAFTCPFFATNANIEAIFIFTLICVAVAGVVAK